MDPSPEATAKAYLDAVMSGDATAVAAQLDPAGLADHHHQCVALADALAPYGEDQAFSTSLGFEDSDSLRATRPLTFVESLLRQGLQALTSAPETELEVEQLSCEVEGDQAELSYAVTVRFAVPGLQLPVTRRQEQQVQLSRRGARWFVNYRRDAMAGGFERLQRNVRRFAERATLDTPRPSAALRPGDEEASEQELEAFAIWGFRDARGETVIEPRFAAAEDFEEGLAPVKVFRCWGFLDDQGALHIPARYAAAKPFSEGYAAIAEGDPLDPKWGFINRDGLTMIEPRFAEVGDFACGLAAAREPEGDWGYIDRDGAFAIAPRFEYAEAFEAEEERAEVTLDGEDYLVDRSGAIHAIDSTADADDEEV